MKIISIKKEDLKYNIEQIKKLAKSNNMANMLNIDSTNNDNNQYKLIGVVKGNGYGLDLIKFAKFLIENGIKTLAVATKEEAIKLRKEGIKEDILMLSPNKIKSEVEELIENDITLTIGSKDSANILIENAQKNPNKIVKIHIKIDTGFGRYGFIYNDIEEILNNIKNLNKIENIKIEGIFSHFSIAYYKNNRYTEKQFNRFINVINILKQNNINIEFMHICNSPAFLNYPNMRLNAARIGSAFVGRVNSQSNLKFRSIGEIKTNIVEIKELPKGYNVSYLKAYKTKKQTKIAIVQVGYGDGYNVTIKNDMFRLIDKLRGISQSIKRFFKKERIKVKINNKNYNVIRKNWNVSFNNRYIWK